MKRELIERLVTSKTLFADGLDDAIIGVVELNGAVRVVYDRDKVIRVLVDKDNLPEEDAVEYYEYNIACAYMGKHTPIFTTPEIFLGEIDD